MIENNKTGVDDIDLSGAVAEVDEFLLQLSIKNKFSPLVASSVILARLVWLNSIGNSTEDFSKLLGTIVNGIDDKTYDVGIQERNVH
jgi:hypothetical protein